MSKTHIDALLTDLKSTLDLGEQLDIVNGLLQHIKKTLTTRQVREIARTGLLYAIVEEACNKFIELKLHEITTSELEEKFQLLVEGFQWLMEIIGHK